MFSPITFNIECVYFNVDFEHWAQYKQIATELGNYVKMSARKFKSTYDN